MNKSIFNKADQFSRRRFVSNIAAGCLGLSYSSGLLSSTAQAQTVTLRKGAKAKSVIYLYMNGGMSHIDSFDVKPENNKVKGEASAIKTNADGMRVSKFFPNMAKQMNHVAAINSLTSTQGAHPQGNYFMHTSYESRGTIAHPHMGSWVNHLAGNVHGTLPANIKIRPGKTLGAGWMAGKYAALPIDNPNDGVKYSSRHRRVSENQFNGRLNVLDKMNHEFQQKYKQKSVREYSDIYKDAVKLMSSKDLDAFDISNEKSKDAQAYGNNSFGQGCLLARRLVQKGVRWVEVNLGGWDHHDNIYEGFTENAKTLDQAMAALLNDLNQKGMLESTMVVLATEFGRGPIINQRAGRDHYPKAFTCLLAGGGIKGGQAVGKTDKDGMNVIGNKVKVQDFNATIAHGLGLPLAHKLTSPTGRPFTIADRGKPITSLF
ncbi:MAG: DUF1501 domain-containing protein [Lentisphaeraceae bacterium]|nr:DUF1501 domain-containing protein [Lentisphaeraceae bacterium]